MRALDADAAARLDARRWPLLRAAVELVRPTPTPRRTTRTPTGDVCRRRVTLRDSLMTEKLSRRRVSVPGDYGPDIMANTGSARS